MENNTETRNTILIVDDEEMNLKVLSAFLRENYDISTASSGRQALEMAQENQPDLILLDVMMPGMDGYEVLTALKKDEKTWKIPVIFITGLDSKEDEEKGLEMNAADYISKPFSVGIVKLRVKNQIQIVNQIRTIEALSMMDQLTGIPNRRNLDNRFIMEWTRAFREKQPLSFMMMDIDKFKLFNDTYGHQIGDDVLKMVAGSFGGALKRKSDFAARFGGEEFSILLPNTTSDGAKEIAERVRQTVEQLVVPCGNGKTTKVTISIGLHTASPTEGEEIAEIISKADRALYQAKESGRNRVCIFDVNMGLGDSPHAPSGTAGNTPGIPDSESPAPDSTEILAAIGKVEGINAELGLSRFGKMEDVYIETVQLFTQRAPVVTEEMDTALEADDIKKFSITVHSVKSMLGTIGASEISRAAEKLEAAGKSGDAQYCKTNYRDFRAKLMKLSSDLTAVFSSTNTGPGRKKIIHCDDVNYTLVSLKGRLEKYYEIYSVSRYQQILKLLDSITPDLILLDVKMPEMDGFEIISELKASPRSKDIPVIFLTSVNDVESVSKCRELGAADIVTKPIADAELIRRINNVIT